MARFRIATTFFVIAGFLVMTSSGSALALGNTVTVTQACVAGDAFLQLATDSSYSYAVPPGGGIITS